MYHIFFIRSSVNGLFILTTIKNKLERERRTLFHLKIIEKQCRLWFSNFSGHNSPLEGLLEHRCWLSSSMVSASLCLDETQGFLFLTSSRAMLLLLGDVL